MKTPQTEKTRRALAVLNGIAARELGASVPRRSPRVRRSDAFADIKKYRKTHPQATLREAAIACGRKIN